MILSKNQLSLYDTDNICNVVTTGKLLNKYLDFNIRKSTSTISDHNACICNEDVSIKKKSSKDDLHSDPTVECLYKNLYLKQGSKETIDTVSLENCLDKEFLHLINSPTTVNRPF